MMSNVVSTIDGAQAASGSDAPDPEDGWRNGGLPALRAELDRIDNAIHDLLMQRAAKPRSSAGCCGVTRVRCQPPR
jgi:hypothetical protein